MSQYIQGLHYTMVEDEVKEHGITLEVEADVGDEIVIRETTSTNPDDNENGWVFSTVQARALAERLLRTVIVVEEGVL